jgi:hypothetical protein
VLKIGALLAFALKSAGKCWGPSRNLRRLASLRSWQQLGNASGSERDGAREESPLSETRPEVVALARKLRRRRPKAGQLSLRAVASELAARGYLNERGKPYAAKSVASMLR